MAGINLSQSIQEKQAQAQVRFFDRGLVAGIVILILLAVTAGGVRWYVGSIQKEMLELDMSVSQKTVTLKGREIDRLVDFADRVQFVKKHIETEPDPIEIMRLLEEHTLTSIRLTEFKFSRSEAMLLVMGEAPSLKEIAQQMLAFKHLETIDQVTVEGITYSESGRILFSLRLKQRQSLETP